MITKLKYYLLISCLAGSLFQKVNAQVINYETIVTVADNGEKTTEIYVLIQINSKDNNSASHVELSHDHNEKFSVNYARILDKEGNIIRKLKKKDLNTRSSISNYTFYQDDVITEFDLYWNQYPYRIEYSYTIKEKEYLFLAWWTPLVIKNATTIKSSLEVNLPSDFRFKFTNPDNIDFVESQENNRIKLRWKALMVNYPKEEIFSPAMEQLIPVVKVIPNEFTYGISGNTDSWSSFGLWLDKLNYGTDELTPKEKATIENLTNGISNKNDIIKTLYYYLQDKTKYVNVSIDIGGLKSYPASYVCENKYGDCKALTTYMKAMLKSLGIESFYTIVNAGETITEIDTNLPGQQFDHVILMIPLKNDTIWLENTASALPYNYLGTFTQNRYALAINGVNSRLVKTPELTANDVLLERFYDFHLTDNDKTEVNLDIVLRGDSFEEFRYYVHENEEKKQKLEISQHLGIKNLTDYHWDITDFHRDSTFLHLIVNGSSSSVLRKLGTFQVINPLRIELPDFEDPDERKSDVIINLPISKYDKSIYKLKNTWQKEVQIPEGIKIENEYGSYSANFLNKNNELIVIEKFTLLANKFTIDNYKSFYEFIKTINTYKKKNAILIK